MITDTHILLFSLPSTYFYRSLKEDITMFLNAINCLRLQQRTFDLHVSLLISGKNFAKLYVVEPEFLKPFFLVREAAGGEGSLQSLLHKRSTAFLKGPLLALQYFLTIENPLKIIKNGFYFTLKAPYVIEISTFLS